MAKIPAFFIGRQATSYAIVPCTAGSDGTLTEGTSANLVGRIDEIQTQSRNTLESITPMDNRQVNNVIVESESTVTLTEILQNSGQGSVDNALALLAYTYDYAKFTLARAGKTFTFYAVVGEYNETTRKGKCTGTLTLHNVSLTSGINGTSAPSYSANINYA